MRPILGFVASWRLACVLLTTLLASAGLASPSVNVALRASFDSGPYLIELLETAAEENPASYFPLLDRVAEGAFDDVVTDKELYDRFLQVVADEGYLSDPESMSSFKLSLAIRSASPRVAAHYQFYNTSVQNSLMAAQDAACPVWVHSDGKQYCSSTMERAQQDVDGELDARELPFDRVLGHSSLPPAILYADLASPMFRDFHQTLSALAKDGEISYRVRYRPPQHWSPRPLFASGYGVELALKRTDYIVIDDRDAEERGSNIDSGIPVETAEAPGDLRPLSSSEVARLGLNTVSYVAGSKVPLDTLLKLSQDFPKYSSTIAVHNTSVTLLDEIRANRLGILPSGANAMWINGVQIDPRQIDAFSLVDNLRRERRLINSFRSLGLTAQEAVDLLSHEAIAESVSQDTPQRYDYRDELEGGGVIIWLNNLEKDAKYESWPSELTAFLRRTYPGQLPPVRRDLNNIVFPVDFTNAEDVDLVVTTIQMFVKRKIPVRFGVVPMASSSGSIAQLKMAHYLQETFGLGSLMAYLEQVSKKKLATVDKAVLSAVTQGRAPRAERRALSMDEIMNSEELGLLATRTAKYQERLAINGDSPVVFINGIPISRGENWPQEMSMKVDKDLRLIQQGILEGLFEEDTWLPGYFLSQAFERRVPWVVSEDPKDIKLVDLTKVRLTTGELLNDLPHFSSEYDPLESIQVIVIGDFDSASGLNLLTSALEARQKHPMTEMLFIHNPDESSSESRTSSILYRSSKGDEVHATQLLSDITSASFSDAEAQEAAEFWTRFQPSVEDLGLSPGMNGVVVNGRIVKPTQLVTAGDLGQLVLFETMSRIGPVAKAARDLTYSSRLSDPLAFAKLTSLVALSTISDVPEGLFETSSDIRVNFFKDWSKSDSVISVSNTEDPAITISASIDPTSETAQRWLPILKALSKLDGVSLKLFMNPRNEIQELPIKRFYRYVLDSEPSFSDDGSVSRPTASFSGVPVEALLTLGMDVPPSWLVAPQDSIHDLDNIKLSSVKGGSNVDAIYALEHILIEGHSRDLTTKSPPRGVQLVLGTEDNPYFADTIVMANLGYFQFKAQPGVWTINLKPGRSERIFNLESLGQKGYSPQNGDYSNEIALLSFQGKTLFPRLSRKKGQENEDVLESGPKPGSATDFLSKGLNFASGVLSSVGVSQKAVAERNADINIFSVASGHLYERMLNIMMVSVMRNTKHTVKFWFIEQFLSPSFKSFLPHLAAEYGFSYEMVTYKWPHWLRAQKEKQREIWGYKILFLDVLFPLSLDKVIFVDADQIVRTDMYDLVTLDLEGAPYGFTPMCDSRTEMEGFRFWKQGYWEKFLRGLPYHISALYVVDLNRFRQLAAGDRLRGQYQMLSADKNSLSNLDQDLPNHMQHHIPIKSLPQEWLWCETWCSDESLSKARTIDLCNNPQTKEPKLDRARRQVPEWTEYDEEIAELARRVARAQEATAGDVEEQEVEKDEDERGSEWKKDEL